MTILDFFDAARTERPAALAVNETTYDDLHRGSLRVAARLTERGLRRGDRVAIFCENRMAFVFAYLAVLRLGAIVVPVNVLYRAGELQHLLSDAAVALVVCSESTVAHVRSAGEYATVEAAAIETWARDSTLPGAPAERRPQAADDAIVLYTSGTTGRSKGAVLTHSNVAAIAWQVVGAWRWSAADTLYVALPMFHMHGLGAALNGTLTAGSHLIFDERFDARAALARLGAGDISMFFGVPTMYVRLLEALDGPPPTLRLFVSGSAALAPDVFEAFERRFGCQILERYGATEFGFALTNRFAGPRVPGSVGVPTPGTLACIVAPGSSVPVEPGAIGELLIAGPGVTRGYWNAPDATAAAFTLDSNGTNWYRTGDLARYDGECDAYRISGRLKELIITGGFNVYPLEVENELNRLPGILASALVGIEDAARGELPVAFIEVDRPVEPEALREALALRLASFKIPKAFQVVERLPRNALGKVEKHRLRETFAGFDGTNRA